MANALQPRAPQTLSQAVDLLNEARFYGLTPPKAEQRRLSRFIAARQALPGAYAGSFALSRAEQAEGIHVFTGEHMTSASARHIIGEESCSVLRWLGDSSGAVRAALSRATKGIEAHVLSVADAQAGKRGPGGLFCCGRCTVALWRHLVAGGLDHSEQRLAHGLRALRRERDMRGGWGRFPFYYTLLALSEIELPAARSEIAHVAGVCRAKLARKPGAGLYAQRRHDVMARALARL